MKKYSTPEVIFDKFTTEEIAISLGSSVEASLESGNFEDTGAKINFKDTFGL